MHFLAQTTDPAASDAAAGVAVFMIIFFAALAIAGGLWWWAFISAVSKPTAVWEHAGQNKALWVVLQLGLGILGAIGYLVAVRSKLLASQAALQGTPQYFPPPQVPGLPPQPPLSTGVGGQR